VADAIQRHYMGSSSGGSGSPAAVGGGKGITVTLQVPQPCPGLFTPLHPCVLPMQCSLSACVWPRNLAALLPALRLPCPAPALSLGLPCRMGASLRGGWSTMTPSLTWQCSRWRQTVRCPPPSWVRVLERESWSGAGWGARDGQGGAELD
jgi:hypothetical protein